MRKLSVIALALGSIVAHPALSQSLEFKAPLGSATPPKNDDGQLKAHIKDSGASVRANEAPPTPSNMQSVPPLAIPKCYAIGSIEAPSASANWARIYTNPEGRSTYVDTTTIKHCTSGDDFTVKYWKKIDLGKKSYGLSSADYNCSRRKQENSPKSWLYFNDGLVVESDFDVDISNPIPTSPIYNLVRYICNSNLNRSLAEVPAQVLHWVTINQEGPDVTWDILETDLDIKSEYGKTYAEFWLRKDYSKAKWTKYRRSYSYDKIDCADARYVSGQSFAFLPNEDQGEAVSDETIGNYTMRNIFKPL